MKRIKRFFAILLIAAAGGGFLLYKQMQSGLTIKVTEGQINASLAQRFPVEKEYLVLKVELAKPEVSLNEEQDRMEVEVNAVISTPKPLAFAIGNKEIGIGKETSNAARVRVSGEIDYDPANGTFFFKNAEILEVELNEPDAPGDLQEKIKTAVSFVAKQVLNRMPVYALDEAQGGTRTAKLLLDDVQIEGGKVVVQLKLPE